MYRNVPAVVDGALVQPVDTTHDLQVVFTDSYSDLGASVSHMRRTVFTSSALTSSLTRHQRLLFLPDSVRPTCAHEARLRYGNFVLVGLPVYQQCHLNSAARLIYRLRRYDQITDPLTTFHWMHLDYGSDQSTIRLSE